jgi:flagellar hook assembly protein FlgD
MANQNPTRPQDIDKIISQLLNPKETQSQKNERIKKEIQKLLEK